jgi:hypothetical protein
MTDQSKDIFGEDQLQTTSESSDNQSKDTSNTVTLPDGVAELVGEGKKYASTEEALKSIPHAQEHISNLEAQLKELREDLSQRAAIEDVLSKINSSQVGDQQVSNSLSAEAVQELINNTLSVKEAAALKAANAKKANDTIVSQYGEKAKDVVAAKAAELGVSVAYLKGVAEQSPNAFLAYFSQNTSNTAPPRTPSGDMQTHNINMGVKEDTYSYFQKLRRENPSEYHRPETQMRMHRLAKQKGDDFYKS